MSLLSPAKVRLEPFFVVVGTPAESAKNTAKVGKGLAAVEWSPVLLL